MPPEIVNGFAIVAFLFIAVLGFAAIWMTFYVLIVKRRR